MANETDYSSRNTSSQKTSSSLEHIHLSEATVMKKASKKIREEDLRTIHLPTHLYESQKARMKEVPETVRVTQEFSITTRENFLAMKNSILRNFKQP
jgi:hypothetical protein